MSTDTNPDNMFRVDSLLGLVVVSQVNIIVQPINAEAHEKPEELAIQAQRIATLNKKPVVLLDRDGNRKEFNP